MDLLDATRRRQKQNSVQRLERLFRELLLLIAHPNSTGLLNKHHNGRQPPPPRRDFLSWFFTKNQCHFEPSTPTIHRDGATTTTTATDPADHNVDATNTTTATTTDQTTTATTSSTSTSADDLEAMYWELAAIHCVPPPLSVVYTNNSNNHHNNNNDDDYYANVQQVLLKKANKQIQRLVSLIREMGTILIHAERAARPLSSNSHQQQQHYYSLRDDHPFAYFCEKNILRVWIAMATAVPPPPLIDTTSVEDHPPNKQQQHQSHPYSGIVWTPQVKAELFTTLTLLIDQFRDKTALYYLLSQHSVTIDLLSSVLPLTQYTQTALLLILNALVPLIKVLCFQLGASPELFCFFTISTTTTSATNNDNDNNNDNKTTTTTVQFPLFTVLVHIVTSSVVSQRDSFVHNTCLNLLVGLMRLSDPAIGQWMANSNNNESAPRPEWRVLCQYLAKNMMERHQRLVDVATGPVVDAVRAHAVQTQLGAIVDLLETWSDLFWCKMDRFNVRLCETLLSSVVAPLLHRFLPACRTFLTVGVSDLDVIPGCEAAAQASTLVLIRLFEYLDYDPFVRMVAVALMHEKVSERWMDKGKDAADDATVKEPRKTLTGALQTLVSQDKHLLDELPDNPFRAQVFRALAGDYGEWRVASAALLVEHILRSVDDATLEKINLFPIPSSAPNKREEGPIDSTLQLLYSRDYQCESDVSSFALERASSLTVQYLHRFSKTLLSQGVDVSSCQKILSELPTRSALEQCKRSFFEKALASRNMLEVNDVFVNLVQDVVRSRYKRTTVRKNTQVETIDYVYNLAQSGSNGSGLDSEGGELLVRKMSGVNVTQVEKMRFHIRLAIHYRAMERIADRLISELGQGSMDDASLGSTGQNTTFPMVDHAAELSGVFPFLQVKPPVGSDLDLRGRTTFRFSLQCNTTSDHNHKPTFDDERRTPALSEEMIFRNSSNLVAVLDPADLFIVKPFPSLVNRGTIVCQISYMDVVASACDDNRLHIAVRHENVGSLIKNGNMVLVFDSPGNCVVALQYLDRCRRLLQDELYEKILDLFAIDNASGRNNDIRGHTGTVPHVNTF